MAKGPVPKVNRVRARDNMVREFIAFPVRNPGSSSCGGRQPYIGAVLLS